MINKIFILESLESNEKKTGHELYHDILMRYNEFYNGSNSTLMIEFCEVVSRIEVVDALRKISAEITEVDEIVLHFEAHGNPKGLVLCNDEQINWVDFSNLLMEINKKTKNKLHITMATCYGRYIYLGLKLDKTSLFRTLISASDKVYPYEILEDYSLFFEHLVKTRNITGAFLSLYKSNPDSKFIYKDMEEVLKLYLEHICNILNVFPDKSINKQMLESLLGISINNCNWNIGLQETREKIKEIYFDKFLMRSNF